MKKLALAAVLSAAATTAFAGNIEPAPLEPVVIVEDTTSSAGGIIVPLIAAIIIAAAIAAD